MLSVGWYNRRTNNGTSGFNGSVQFSIPQFGDFFSDMVANVKLAATSASVGTVPAFPAFVGASDQVATSTSSVSAVQNTTTGVYTKYTHEYVNGAGTVVAVGAAAQNFVRYAEYPGQRLFKKVKFEVNGNPLDEYTAEAMMFKQKFMVSPGKLTGWKRLVGQEVPLDGYSDLASVSGTTTFGSQISNLIDINGAAVPASPTNASATARKLVKVCSGPQTPQLTQPILEMWIPLIFWFNEDSRLSIPSVSIPYGQPILGR